MLLQHPDVAQSNVVPKHVVTLKRITPQAPWVAVRTQSPESVHCLADDRIKDSEHRRIPQSALGAHIREAQVCRVRATLEDLALLACACSTVDALSSTYCDCACACTAVRMITPTSPLMLRAHVTTTYLYSPALCLKRWLIPRVRRDFETAAASNWSSLSGYRAT